MPYQTGLTFNYDCGDFPRIVAAEARARLARGRVRAAEKGADAARDVRLVDLSGQQPP